MRNDHDDIDALRGWVERLEALHRAIDEAELATLRARRTGDAMTTELLENVAAPTEGAALWAALGAAWAMRGGA